jgi:hypothetical protein
MTKWVSATAVVRIKFELEHKFEQAVTVVTLDERTLLSHHLRVGMLVIDTS